MLAPSVYLRAAAQSQHATQLAPLYTTVPRSIWAARTAPLIGYLVGATPSVAIASQAPTTHCPKSMFVPVSALPMINVRAVSLLVTAGVTGSRFEVHHPRRQHLSCSPPRHPLLAPHHYCRDSLSSHRLSLPQPLLLISPNLSTAASTPHRILPPHPPTRTQAASSTNSLKIRTVATYHTLLETSYFSPTATALSRGTSRTPLCPWRSALQGHPGYWELEATR